MLYQYQRVWRVIWTDGENFQGPGSRWYGYSDREVGGMIIRFWVETVGLGTRDLA